MASQNVLERIGRAIIFDRFREPLRSYLLKAGYESVPYSLFSVLFFMAVVVTYGFFLPVNSQYIRGLSLFAQLPAILAFWVIVLSAIIGVIMVFIWSYLNLKIYSRTKEMEEKLPDYLSLVVTNLRSGMSFDKSLWGAIRPEFGVLAREITIVSKKVMTGNDTGEALEEFARRYDSPILRRSMNLVISELESGGEVASVIERVIENLRKTSELKKEMAASVISYMIFIAAIVMVLAPILFSLANTILKVILSFADQIARSPSVGTSAAQGLFRTLGRLSEAGSQLTSDFRIFTFMALGTTSFFAAIIVSIIEKGDVRGGLKYIPVFIVVAITVFYIADRIFSSVFSTLL